MAGTIKQQLEADREFMAWLLSCAKEKDPDIRVIEIVVNQIEMNVGASVMAPNGNVWWLQIEPGHL